MPGGDRTGPMGLGPMTGRAVGFCAGFGMPGYANPAPGRGFGMGFGRGRGFGGRGGGGRGYRHMFYATGLPGWLRTGWSGVPPYGALPVQATEREHLKNVAEALQGQLDEIKKRLDDLAGQEGKESE